LIKQNKRVQASYPVQCQMALSSV